ncbi:MAG: branched-chain amino acid ABC transporter permease [Gammaproteobacteria bacterium]|nr:branched-chain amino acid ABC transporter permease [Gammaproteobacteria bacterium]NIM74571.1 branched-chain amino acid ABC transporter permease [Gammaproteobacteria bacterium]NIO26404.1 branched-chain amino acid ABC transporter permease [Gammaproteobacteria bacterium]NIO66956.1 branched-chain amino acid ABC transporter permease [Gammaproteobacteria bacterium]NIP44965.1 branched-chain amino acid ABC transporter permease [Gammaproteobacteria bacterium]
MLYREAGQFKTSYAGDQAIFPIIQDRWFVLAVLLVAYLVVPFVANDYFFEVVLIPFLVFSMAAIGLNLLLGYAGQLSLGTGAFMGLGAFMSYKLLTTFPDLNLIVAFLLAGLATAVVGLLFGIPSLRIKGFYLAVSTLAAQFLLGWMFTKVEWFYNYNPSGTILTPPREMFGVLITSPKADPAVKYLVALTLVAVFALAAKNIVRSRIGRSWMAIRDMDIAAEIIGFRPMQTKLMAFAVSSFYCGVAGAMLLCLDLDAAEGAEAFGINISFNVLFMVIIGGLGSILGSFLGAAFITLVPVVLTNAPQMFGIAMATDMQKHLEVMIFGGLIVYFLIVEPHGLARLWQIAKEKLRIWPFPY